MSSAPASPRMTSCWSGGRRGGRPRIEETTPGIVDALETLVDPVAVQVHDFMDDALGKVIPYGVYDLARNTGWVSVGIT